MPGCDLKQYQEDHVGLVPIYEPSGHCRGRIIAFHGPGGSWWKTWSQNAANASDASTDESFWLRTELPRRFPHCAVYSVGHVSEWFYKLQSERFGTDRTSFAGLVGGFGLRYRGPIVFIAHGFGGIQLQDLMLTIWGSDGEKSRTPYLDRVKGVVFLATPHQLTEDLDKYRPLFFENKEQNAQKADFLFPDNTGWSSDARNVTKKFRRFVKSLHGALRIQSMPRSTEIIEAEHWLEELPSDAKILSMESSTYFALPKLPEASQVQEICDCLQNLFGLSLEYDRDTQWTYLAAESVRPFDETLWSYEDSDVMTGTRRTHSLGPCLSLEPKYSPDSWIHFPINEVCLFNGAANVISSQLHFHSSAGLYQAFQIETISASRTGGALSESVRPNINLHRERLGDRNREEYLTILRICLPYLSWTYETSVQKGNRRAPTFSGGGWAYFCPQYHPRRTLDEFYHPLVKDIHNRNRDQVISRQTRDAEKRYAGPSPTSKILMVDQLWLLLFIVEDSSGNALSSSVLTSFPSTHDASKSPAGEGHVGNLTNVEDNVADSATGLDLASSILQAALVQVVSNMQQHWSLHIFQLFREAIATVTEKNDRFFRIFARNLRNSDKPELKPQQKTDWFSLAFEVADVIEEAQMLTDLFETQRNLLTRQPVNTGEPPSASLDPVKTKMNEIAKHIDDNFAMPMRGIIADAKRTQEKLINFLDLQHKETTIREAQSRRRIAESTEQQTKSMREIAEFTAQQTENMKEMAEITAQQTKSLNQTATFTARQALAAQKQADSTDAQSQILFIFTLVTVVFLPLSFFTSWFGMNIDDGTEEHGSVNHQYSRIRTIMAAASTPIIGGLFLISAILYWYSTTSAEKERTKLFVEIAREVKLPASLLSGKQLKAMEVQCAEKGLVFNNEDGLISVEEKSVQQSADVSASVRGLSINAASPGNVAQSRQSYSSAEAAV